MTILTQQHRLIMFLRNLEFQICSKLVKKITQLDCVFLLVVSFNNGQIWDLSKCILVASCSFIINILKILFEEFLFWLIYVIEKDFMSNYTFLDGLKHHQYLLITPPSFEHIGEIVGV